MLNSFREWSRQCGVNVKWAVGPALSAAMAAGRRRGSNEIEPAGTGARLALSLSGRRRRQDGAQARTLARLRRDGELALGRLHTVPHALEAVGRRAAVLR